MGMSQEMIAPMINSLQMTDTVKGMDLDTISISLGVPKYKHGYAISLKIPGISKVLGGILDAAQQTGQPQQGQSKQKEQAKPEQAKPEQSQPEQPKPEQSQPEQPKPEQPQPEHPKQEQPQPEQPKPEN